MKTVTKNLIAFSVAFFVLTVAFRFSLSSLLQNRLFNHIWIIAAIYGILAFVTGWIFGKSGKKDLPLYNIGFRYHLATFIIFNLIAEVWFLIGLQSEYENVRTAHLTAIFWGIGLLIHFIIYLINGRNAIKGINRSELFE